MSREQIEAFILDVKEGDVVCDCSYHHQTVVRITPEYTLRRWVRALLLAIPSVRIRVDLWKFIVDKGYPKLVCLWDKELLLENGDICSARYCSWPVNHPDWPCTFGD